jgi:hypothetical protein
MKIKAIINLHQSRSIKVINLEYKIYRKQSLTNLIINHYHKLSCDFNETFNQLKLV